VNPGTEVRIRPLTLEDLDGALALSSAAGWNQRAEDWRMLLRLAPAGALAAEDAGLVIGTAIGIDYAGFGWIAMMLVDPAHRERGLGGRLLEAALAALPADRTVRLDATPLGRPLYERHGFRDEARLVRYVAPAARAAPLPAATARGGEVRQMTQDDLDDVCRHDPGVFHGNRSGVLAWALTDAPCYARIVSGSSPPEYCFGRSGRLFDQIGPVVAASEAAACALVRAAIPSAGRRALVIDAFEAHEAFTRWLRTCGFEPQRPLFRMMKGPAPGQAPASAASPPDGAAELAIFGPEFA
jgi:GNAT superfamily N-acetyltransferase